MKEFNFDDFQEAWDAQEKVFNQMELVHEEEVKKMIADASIQREKEHTLQLRSAKRKQWLWRGAVAACIISVVVTTMMTIIKMSPIPKSQIGISQDIISQTNEQYPTPYQNYGDMEQTELQSLSTTETDELDKALMLDKTGYGSLSSAEAGRHKSEVMVQNPMQEIVSTESGVTLEVAPDAYQMRPAKSVDNYGHEAYVMSNRKCNVNQIVYNLQKIL